jgi:hypothetical protein
MDWYHTLDSSLKVDEIMGADVLSWGTLNNLEVA